MTSVGIFAGTFDPIHDGHIAFAQAAAKVGGLECVYLLPEHQPRAKGQATDFKQRLAFLKDALRPYPKLCVLVLPEDRFTIDGTIPRLRAELPGAELTFIMGSDAGFRLPQWPGINKVLPDVRLIIGLRAGDSEAGFKEFLSRELPLARATIIASPEPHISSSKLRQSKARSKIDM